jgi:GTP-binding protein LepA
VIDGVLRPKTKMRLMATKQDFEVLDLGVFSPKATPVDELGVGEVGFRRSPTSRSWPTPRSATR